MRRFLSCILLLSLGSVAAAQTPINNPNATESESEPLTPERIDQLITTLESETARAEFIDNLKTLAAAKDEQDATRNEPSVSRMLDLDETSSGLLQAFAELLNSAGLADSQWGQWILFGVVVVCILIAVLINNWTANFFNRRLTPVRNRMRFDRRRFSGFFVLQRWFGVLFALLLLVYAAQEIFGVLRNTLDQELSPGSLAQYTLVILVVCTVFVGVWEAVNAFMEYGSYRSNRLRHPRMQTLLPIMRNVLLFVLLTLATMIVLSELNIDIMPLLAGAGVLGIAVGFGAQALVKDFLQGFIIIFEDLLQVGDVVRVGGRIGLVEKITIRKIQLRDLDGTVHTVPFSEITVVDNLTKEYSYYLMDIGVAYRENVDEVIDCIKEVLEEMRADDDYKDKILEPLEVLGVDKFADSAVMIKARIKTIPLQQWSVGREFNRRMKHAFDERDIEIPFPHQTLYFGQDKHGDAPKAQVELYEAQRARREQEMEAAAT